MRGAGGELTDRELADVEDEQDAAVAVDRRPGDGGEPAEETAELLDDQLELALERVDRQGHRLVGPRELHDHRRPRVAVARHVEDLAEVDERQHAVLADEHGHSGDLVTLRAGEAHRLEDTGDRHGVALRPDAGDQAAQHAERDRQRDGERRAQPGLGRHLDGAAEVLHDGAYDVEADAAAGGLRHLGAGREPGREHQLQQCRT